MVTCFWPLERRLWLAKWLCENVFFPSPPPTSVFFFFCFVLLLATLNGALISHYSLICLCRWLILLSVFMYLLALRISSKKCLKSSYSVCCSASSFYILDANPLSDEQLVNALSHSWAVCSLWCKVIPFAMQKVFSLI